MEMVYMKNLSDADITKMLSSIKEKNGMLYDVVYDVLNSPNMQGIRKDVLAYLATHGDETIEDSYILSFLIGRREFSAEWYSWLKEYMESEMHIRIDDIGILLNEAVERNISLEELKVIVKGKESLVEVFPMLEREGNDTGEQAIAGCDEDDVYAAAEVSEGLEAAAQNGNIPAQEQNIHGADGREPYFGVLNDMLTVMSGAGQEEKTSVLSVQDNLNQIAAKFQSALTELSTCSTEIVRGWEKDRGRIERQTALYHLYQNIIRSQQMKINEMRNEINRLNALRKAEEKKARERKALSQKITELQMFATDIERNDSYRYLSGE